MVDAAAEACNVPLHKLVAGGRGNTVLAGVFYKEVCDMSAVREFSKQTAAESVLPRPKEVISYTLNGFSTSGEYVPNTRIVVDDGNVSGAAWTYFGTCG